MLTQNKQAGFDDCGVFAAAYCTALSHGQNPSSYVYNQSMMREHLIKCLEGSEMLPFPVMRERRVGPPSSFKIDVYTVIADALMTELRWCSVTIKSARSGFM